ncbi:hypothetical protein K437DRAFT_258573 [Tilletiaria anomala UBC 951]|uniref:GATA-type domain-containing protein n=1 Tax=Tilletiaria anomala (strain ATCC 24038 / CBS 436.72 / UBC 951) TaxID=1037660 RepID=A0A066VQ29_TILAU|nr:uncharacterized protein K437DRAFT_258573 [Tilletiaria anomala UBC 951]KDN40705.1 hypothetical protein K437DRAFT_258573 [Tilletiaria anomala UBC 951]
MEPPVSSIRSNGDGMDSHHPQRHHMYAVGGASSSGTGGVSSSGAGSGYFSISAGQGHGLSPRYRSLYSHEYYPYPSPGGSVSSGSTASGSGYLSSGNYGHHHQQHTASQMQPPSAAHHEHHPVQQQRSYSVSSSNLPATTPGFDPYLLAATSGSSPALSTVVATRRSFGESPQLPHQHQASHYPSSGKIQTAVESLGSHTSAEDATPVHTSPLLGSTETITAATAAAMQDRRPSLGALSAAAAASRNGTAWMAVPFKQKHSPFPLPLSERVAGGVSSLVHKKSETLQQSTVAGGGVAGDASGKMLRYDPADNLDFFEEVEDSLQDSIKVDLGKTRCYWNILALTDDDDLKMVYCDPTLQEHLGSELPQFLGTSFFNYVHEEELEQCKADIRRSITNRTLTGDLSRVRYCRVPEIRRRLGCKAPPIAPNSDAYVYDQSYVTIDIVINWVGERLALAFYHAITDQSPQDNSITQKTEWTNWCGAPKKVFTMRQCDMLWKQVSRYVPRSPSPGSPLRYVFQIHRAENNGDILFSWPPPRLFPKPVDEMALAHSTFTTYSDGSYFADDFAKMTQGFLPTFDQAARNAGSVPPDQPQTSCTRRYRLQHTLTSEGLTRKVDGIVVPYGSLVFTCSHIVSEEAMSRYRTRNDGLTSTSTITASYDLGNGSAADRKYTGSPGITAAAQLLMGTADQAAQAAAATGAQHNQQDWNTSSYGGGGGAAAAGGAAPLDSLADASEKRERLEQAMQRSQGQGSVATLAAVAAAAAAQTKSCTSCGTSNSPEWRKGPTGKKTLCNACGLRFARQMARQRRKAEGAGGGGGGDASSKLSKANGGKGAKGKGKGKGKGKDPGPGTGAAGASSTKAKKLRDFGSNPTRDDEPAVHAYDPQQYQQLEGANEMLPQNGHAAYHLPPQSSVHSAHSTFSASPHSPHQQQQACHPQGLGAYPSCQQPQNNRAQLYGSTSDGDHTYSHPHSHPTHHENEFSQPADHQHLRHSQQQQQPYDAYFPFGGHSAQ